MLENDISFEDINLNESIQQSLKFNGIRFRKVDSLRYSVNKNFKVVCEDGDLFLRVYRPNKETSAQILAEHEFLMFLKRSGLNVAVPKVLADGSTLGVIRTSSHHVLYFALFDFLVGSHPTDLHDFAVDWGKSLGQLHELSRKYSKSRKTYERHSWDQTSWIIKSEELLKKVISSAEVSLFLNERHRTIEYLKNLPRSDEEFGLIHYDFHQGNLLVDECGHIQILDFDDCCSSWFVWDFALPMHRLGGTHMSHQGMELKQKFIKGYREVCSLPLEWENRIRNFERIRHLCMLCWLAERHTEKKWKDIIPRYLRAHGEYLIANPEFEFE